jgi:mannose-6-phosphate isomerase-like protein (cupin superfamily)
MPIRKSSLKDIPVQDLPGRKLRWLVTPDTLGVERIGIAIMDCPAGSTVRPLHGHRDTEEVLLILEGQGEAWVDGETTTFKKGDAVLLPANSKHMVRSTGKGSLITASIFSPPTTPASYMLFDNSEGW